MSQLYLYPGLREKYKKEINDLAYMAKERLLFQFSDAEKEAEELKNKLITNKVLGGEGDYENEEESFFEIMDISYEYYELLSLMDYRTKAMAICLLCQVWEQQLYSFIIHEATQDGLNNIVEKKRPSFKLCKITFAEHGIDIDTLDCWETLEELRFLVNVIKHGEGEGERELKQIRPEYFITDASPYYSKAPINTFHNSLVEQNLNISINDFDRFVNAINAFWNELPERMYSEDDI